MWRTNYCILLSLQHSDWQGDKQISFAAKGAGSGFTVTLKVPEEGDYTLSFAGTKAPDYGIYTFALGGREVGKPYDFSWPNVEPTGVSTLGKVYLKVGEHTLRVECAGKSQASEGHFVGIDWIRLERR